VIKSKNDDIPGTGQPPNGEEALTQLGSIKESHIVQMKSVSVPKAEWQFTVHSPGGGQSSILGSCCHNLGGGIWPHWTPKGEHLLVTIQKEV
jgi:hypothetical protein